MVDFTKTEFDKHRWNLVGCLLEEPLKTPSEYQACLLRLDLEALTMQFSLNNLYEKGQKSHSIVFDVSGCYY
jgi:hypothetical protein